MSYKKFQLSNNTIIEVPSYMTNKEGLLFNTNTKTYEALDGDVVHIMRNLNGKTTTDVEIVKEYTNYQIVPTLSGTRVLSAEGLHKGSTTIKIIHKTSIVEELSEEIPLTPTKPSTIYISGAMSGRKKEDYFEQFEKAETKLKEEGWSVTNPSTLSVNDTNMSYKEILLHDLQLLSTHDAIYMLEGWSQSKGATAELYFAKAIGLEIIYE